jgi:hypothetical protein
LPLWWENETGIGLRKGDYLELPAHEGTLFLTFWRHGWSGHAQIRVDEAVVEDWDLYSPVPWLATFQVENLSRTQRIRIEASGRRNELSRGAEVIFYKASWGRRRSHGDASIGANAKTLGSNGDVKALADLA